MTDGRPEGTTAIGAQSFDYISTIHPTIENMYQQINSVKIDDEKLNFDSRLNVPRQCELMLQLIKLDQSIVEDCLGELNEEGIDLRVYFALTEGSGESDGLRLVAGQLYPLIYGQRYCLQTYDSGMQLTMVTNDASLMLEVEHSVKKLLKRERYGEATCSKPKWFQNKTNSVNAADPDSISLLLEKISLSDETPSEPSSKVAIFIYEHKRPLVANYIERIQWVYKRYKQLALTFHQERLQAMRTDSVGPKIMLMGPPDSGKSSLCKMLVNESLNQGWAPIFADIDPGQGTISVPGTLGKFKAFKTACLLIGFASNQVLL